MRYQTLVLAFVLSELLVRCGSSSSSGPAATSGTPIPTPMPLHPEAPTPTSTPSAAPTATPTATATPVPVATVIAIMDQVILCQPMSAQPATVQQWVADPRVKFNTAGNVFEGNAASGYGATWGITLTPFNVGEVDYNAGSGETRRICGVTP